MKQYKSFALTPKRVFFLVAMAIFFSFSLVSCLEQHYLTEQYIKTNIENHKEGNTSAIRIYSLYQTTCFNGEAYIEFTAYKLNGAKGLVIGADKYYLERHRYKGDITVKTAVNYVQLTVSQCQSILDNYKGMQQRIKGEKPKTNEVAYEDFAVSGDVFISYSKSAVSYGNATINIWVKGEKFSVASASFTDMLTKFINY